MSENDISVEDRELFFEGHTDSVNQLQLTSDDKEFITCSSDFTIRIWDLATYGLKKVLKGHTHEVLSISLSQYDDILISSSKDKTIRVWDLNQYTDEIFLTNSFSVSFVLLSKNLKYIAGSSANGEIRLWSFYNKELVFFLRGTFIEIYALVFTPDDKHIIKGSTHTFIEIWKISENNQIPMIKLHKKYAGCISLSRNGKYLASCINLYCTKNSIMVWNFPDDHLEAEFEYYYCEIKDLIISPDNNYVLASMSEGSVQIWSLITKTLVKVLVSQAEFKCNLAITKDNKTILITGKKNVIIQPWSEDQIQTKCYLNAMWSSVNCLALTSDNTYLISGHDDYTLRIWDLIKKTQISSLDGHISAVLSVAITADNTKVISSSFDRTIILWDMKKKVQIAVLKSHIFAVYCLAVYHNKSFAISGSEDKTLIIWDLEKHCEVKMLEKHTAGIYCLGISKNDEIAASASFDCTVLIWDLITGECKHKILNYWMKVNSLEIVQDNSLVFAWPKNGFLCVCDMNNNLEKGFGNANTSYLKLLSDEKYLMCGFNDAIVYLWNFNQNKITHNFMGNTKQVLSVVIAKNINQVISGSYNGTIYIWDIPSDQIPPIQSLQHSGHVKFLKKTHDKNILISYSDDKTIRMWNKQEKCLKIIMKGHQDCINDIKITEDKKFLISGSSDYTIIIWSLPEGILLNSLSCNGEQVLCIGVDNKNQIFVSGEKSGNIIVWDLDGRKKIDKVNKHAKGVSKIGISKCDNFIYSGSCDDTLKVWNLASKEEYLNVDWKHKLLSSLALSQNNKYLLAVNEIHQVYVWKIRYF
ncbi:hypothetical protein SteCoe_14803 [Stentor coeruleus]|uniref:Uncharacterized protein n=1 Tax=Stentor coeruleus TaxID=5963 RepID=A0A1R2C519_9CILI|nr:hypothetical protein SteCoe_14803 [Stentor coeruleus]